VVELSRFDAWHDSGGDTLFPEHGSAGPWHDAHQLGPRGTPPYASCPRWQRVGSRHSVRTHDDARVLCRRTSRTSCYGLASSRRWAAGSSSAHRSSSASAAGKARPVCAPRSCFAILQVAHAGGPMPHRTSTPICLLNCPNHDDAVAPRLIGVSHVRVLRALWRPLRRALTDGSDRVHLTSTGSAFPALRLRCRPRPPSVHRPPAGVVRSRTTHPPTHALWQHA
jgi:hypothetical protein